MSGCCRDCAHWVTHRAFLTINAHPDWPSDQWLGFDHVLSDWREEFRGEKGRCDRANDDAAMMAAECMAEGISGELITKPDFGCREHGPMPKGWDHYRVYRASRHVDSTRLHPMPPDDMAHVEGRL